jgi:hypothetical protein
MTLTAFLQAHRKLVATTVTVYEVGTWAIVERTEGVLWHSGQAACHRTFAPRRNRLIARLSIVRSNPVGRCSMTLTPWDMFVIQTAIDRYEKAFPDKPSPSLAEALEWNANQSGREPRSNVRSPGSNRRQRLWSRASEFILTWWRTSALPRVGVVLVHNRGGGPAKSQGRVRGTD